MLTLAILPLIFAVVATAEQAEVPQDATTFAAAGEEHLKRATTTTENQLDEFQSAHTNFDSAYLVGGATKYLCRALAVADLTLRSATFGNEQERLFWQETRQDDLDRLQQDAAETGRANCRFDATGKPPRVALLDTDTPPALATTTSTLHAADALGLRLRLRERPGLGPHGGRRYRKPCRVAAVSSPSRRRALGRALP